MDTLRVQSALYKHYGLNLPLLKEDEIQDGWVTIQKQPGFFGRTKMKRNSEFDNRFGKGNWRIAWQVKDNFVPFQEAIKLYEEGYKVYFKLHPDILNELLKTAREVYDNAESNIFSGKDYLIQEATSNHYQDISIRRIIDELGLKFLGQDLVKLRPSSKHKIGKKLDPGVVPFHKKELIVQPHLKGWWKPDTIEDFYQSNKGFQIQVPSH